MTVTKLKIDKAYAVLFSLGSMMTLFFSGAIVFLILELCKPSFQQFIAIDYFILIILLIFEIAMLAMFVAALVSFCFCIRQIEVLSEGVTETFLGHCKSTFTWDEIKEVGVGAMAKGNMRFPAKYLYFSKRTLSEKERGEIIDTVIKHRKEVKAVRYSKAMYEYICNIYDKEKINFV